MTAVGFMAASAPTRPDAKPLWEGKSRSRPYLDITNLNTSPPMAPMDQVNLATAEKSKMPSPRLMAAVYFCSAAAATGAGVLWS